MRFKTETKKVFIDIDTMPIQTDELLDIILSPVYYWVKKAQLPVKSVREVKKLLPSLFDDTLPEGSYSYHAYKRDDHYILFAYDEKALRKHLHAKGISPAQINRIYFFQSEFEGEQEPIAIDHNRVMLNQDGVIIVLPSSLVTNSKPLELTNEQPSRHGIRLTRIKHLGENDKSLPLLLSLTAVLLTLFSIELYLISQENRQLQIQKQALTQKYKLKPTSIQNEAVLKDLESAYAQQLRLRQLMKEVLGLSLQNKETISEIILDKGRLLMSIDTITPARQKSLGTALKERGFDFKEEQSPKLWKVEFAL